MNNCLVTKLKDVIDNDNLPLFDKLYYKPIVSGTTNFHVEGYTDNPVIISANGGIVTTTSDVQVTLPESIAAGNGEASRRKFVSTGATSELFVSYKHNLTFVNFPCHLEDIANCEHLTTIGEGSLTCKFIGDIVVLKDLNLTKVNIEYPNNDVNFDLVGDVKVFGNMSNLNYLSLRRCKSIYGAIEDVIVGLIKGGRTSATQNTDLKWVSKESIAVNITMKGSTTWDTASGYFLWASNGNTGEYNISYCKNDGTQLVTEVVKINNDGTWEILS